jgi:hypothetical protein
MDFFDRIPAAGYYPMFALVALNDRLGAPMKMRMIAASAVAGLTCR